jgi:hypothetical protein
MHRLVLAHRDRWHYPAENKMAMLIFHQQQCEKHATLLHVIVNYSLGLVVKVLNTCEFKVTNTTMG